MAAFESSNSQCVFQHGSSTPFMSELSRRLFCIQPAAVHPQCLILCLLSLSLLQFILTAPRHREQLFSSSVARVRVLIGRPTLSGHHTVRRLRPVTWSHDRSEIASRRSHRAASVLGGDGAEQSASRHCEHPGERGQQLRPAHTTAGVTWLPHTRRSPANMPRSPRCYQSAVFDQLNKEQELSHFSNGQTGHPRRLEHGSRAETGD